jgi:hypothetical protein
VLLKIISKSKILENLKNKEEEYLKSRQGLYGE